MLPGLVSAEGFTRNDLNYAAGCSNWSANEATRRETPEAYTFGTLRGSND
jgi:hypothetical protein